LRRYVPLSSITVAKNEASIISDISTLREPQERIHSLKTTYILPSLLEEKDGNSELRDGVKEDKETEGGSLGLPNNRNAKTVPETGRVEEMNSSSSELRATWVRQRCLILKSKIRTDSNNGSLYFC